MALFEATKCVNPNAITLTATVEQDDLTQRIANSFDFEFDGTITTDINLPDFPEDFQIGLIVGSSGSGKSTLLKRFGEIEEIEWDNTKCVASQFGTVDDFDEISKRFGAVGFNSIVTWLKPYCVLSTGEKFRVDVARRLHNNTVIDEFTSVVNRECAISCSVSISKYIRREGLQRVVFASCHDDIIEYLQPDWIYNTDTKELTVGRSVRQKPSITIEVSQCAKQIWDMFKKYHYLSADLNKSADCYLFSYNQLPVGFVAILPMPGRFGDGSDKRPCVSEHRIVLLPDYQGIGLGMKMSQYMAELYLSQGYRYFSKTANPILGEYRNRSSLWRPTCYNQKLKTKRTTVDTITEADISSMMGGIGRMKNGGKGRCATVESAILALTRMCYSHEFIGDENTIIGEHKLHSTPSNRRSLF